MGSISAIAPAPPKFTFPPPEAYKYRFHDGGYLQDYHGCKVFYPNYEILPEVEQFQAHPTDVVIATFPKVGTSFMSAVVHMVLNNGDPASLTSGPNLEHKVPYLEMTLPGMPVGFRPLDKIKNMPSPRAYYTHLNYAGLPESIRRHAKIVYVARNPKDVIVSMHHFMKSMHNQNQYQDMTLEDTAKSFYNNTCTYAPYYDHIADFWTRRHEPNIYFVTFEQMKNDFGAVSRDLAKFLGKDLSDEQHDQVMYHCNFDTMKANELTNRTGFAKSKFFDFDVTPFLRAGKVGNWKEQFSPELNKEVEAWMRQEEDRLQHKLAGLQFVYE